MNTVPIAGLILNNFYILIVRQTRYLIKVINKDDIILKVHFIFLKLHGKISIHHFKSFISASLMASLRIDHMVDYDFVKLNTEVSNE